MAKEFTNEELQEYFSGKTKHESYDETVAIASAMRIHSDGICPGDLIEERRPSESQAVKDYRKKIWKPITKSEFGKVITCLNKIRRSAEWSIRFDTENGLKKLPDGETLAEYFEYRFPNFGNLTSWAFEVMLKAYCVDPNAVVAVMPLQEPVPVNGFVRPYPFIFNSEQVIDYAENEYAVLKSSFQNTYTENGTTKKGSIYYVLNTERIERYEQASADGTYRLAWEYVHNMQLLPCVKTKGIFKEAKAKDSLYESKLAGMIPRLDEAVREYSDLQAEVVQHVFSEKWEFTDEECPACQGKGESRIDGRYMICDKCEGTGAKQRGPYTRLLLKKQMAGESQMPTPPMGYVEKQIDIAKLQDDRIDKHIYKAFSAVNLEFLTEAPLNQSGTAKEVDRDDINTFFNSVAEGLVAILDSVCYFTNEYRNSVIVPRLDDRLELLPVISVPERFDVLTANYLETELNNARKNSINPAIVNAMEIEYANKKFSADPSVRDRVTLNITLDPLAGISEEDKMVRLSNGGVTKTAYVISCNLPAFISRAVEDKGDVFYKLPLKEKKEIITQYAKEQIAEEAPATRLLAETNFGA